MSVFLQSFEVTILRKSFFNVLRKNFLLLLIVFLLCAATVFAQENNQENTPENTVENDPVNFFNLGQEAHEKGEYEAALKLYEKALEIIPEFPEAEYQSGNALLSLNRRDEAEKAFRRAIELRDNWTLPMTSLGVLLAEKNQFDEAEKLLTKAIESSDSNFLAYTALTDLQLKRRASPEELKALLTKIQSLTNKANSTAALWASRAALERALGDKKLAIDSLERAIKIDPLDKFALSEHAEILLDEGDYRGALADANKLRKVSSNSLDLIFLLARIYAGRGDLEDAAKILDSIKNPSAEMKAFRDKIVVNSSQDVVELEKQLEKDDQNAAILGRLCGLLRTADPEKALNYCRRASEAELDNLSNTVGYGAALVQAKKYSEAVELFKKVIEISPDNFAAHTNLATALFQLKRFEEAKVEYNWIIKQQPNLAIAYYFLAIAQDTLEEYPDAAANYQQFLKVADENQNKLEIDKVNLRLPGLKRLVKEKKGKK